MAIDNGKIVKVGTKVLLCSYKDSSLIVEQLSEGGVLSSVKESTNITCNNADTLVGGEYFLINSPTTQYCVWFTMNNRGEKPSLNFVTFLKVNLFSGETSTQVATKIAAILNATGAFVSTSASQVITVTNSVGGNVFPPNPGNSAFSFIIVVKGERKILFDSTLGRNVKKVLDIIISADGSAEILVESEFIRITPAQETRYYNTQCDYKAEYLVTNPGWLF